jgi:hypothetical protein
MPASRVRRFTRLRETRMAYVEDDDGQRIYGVHGRLDPSLYVEADRLPGQTRPERDPRTPGPGTMPKGPRFLGPQFGRVKAGGEAETQSETAAQSDEALVDLLVEPNGRGQRAAAADAVRGNAEVRPRCDRCHGSMDRAPAGRSSGGARRGPPPPCGR